MDVRELREQSGLTQLELAKRSGVDRSKLSLCENGYAQLRPEEQSAVRKVIVEEIESKAAALANLMKDDRAAVLATA